MDLEPFKNCLAHTNSVYISNEPKPYKPCCWFRTGIAADSHEEYQAQLDDLDIATNCSHCIKQESSGATWSHRHLFNNPREFVLGVCFDNVCNLKCVTCTPVHSSPLIKEWSDLNLFNDAAEKKQFIKISNQATEKLDFVKDVLSHSQFDILKLEIFGGEPLISPQVYEFIDWISEQAYAPKTFLSITTNGTVYTDKIAEYCNKFNIVGVQLSIDGIGETFEYLRSGADWNKTVDVMDQYYSVLENASNFSLAFNYTMSWMNCMHFREFFEWTQHRYPKNQTHLTKVEDPKEYSVDVLSLEHRKQIVEINKVTSATDSYQRMYNLYLQSMIYDNHDDFDQELYDKALARMSSKDQLTGNDHTKVLKNIMEFIEDGSVR